MHRLPNEDIFHERVGVDAREVPPEDLPVWAEGDEVAATSTSFLDLVIKWSQRPRR